MFAYEEKTVFQKKIVVLSKQIPEDFTEMNNYYVDGYFIRGSYQTVAWYKTKQEADVMCRKMNFGMATGFYKVIPSYCTKEKNPGQSVTV